MRESAADRTRAYGAGRRAVESPPMHRRLLSRLFALATGVSLVVFVATVVLWVRSYGDSYPLAVRRTQIAPGPHFNLFPRQCHFINWRGQLALTHHRPGPRGLIDQLRGTRGNSQVVVLPSSPTWPELFARIKVVVLDPEKSLDPRARRVEWVKGIESENVYFAKGSRLSNGGGFGLTVYYPPAKLPDSKFIGSVFQAVLVPHWFLALVTVVLPSRRAAAYVSIRRSRFRMERGLCARCAYDLTGNTSGVCPECGTPVVEVAA